MQKAKNRSQLEATFHQIIKVRAVSQKKRKEHRARPAGQVTAARPGRPCGDGPARVAAEDGLRAPALSTKRWMMRGRSMARQLDSSTARPPAIYGNKNAFVFFSDGRYSHAKSGSSVKEQMAISVLR